MKKIEWKLTEMEKKFKALPQGASCYSPVFTAAGIEDILIEFYPNGSQNTTKPGFCALYLRCKSGTAIVITLQVGQYKRGPISATFEGQVGKGLPDFCEVRQQVEADDSITITIEITNSKAAEAQQILKFES